MNIINLRKKVCTRDVTDDHVHLMDGLAFVTQKTCIGTKGYARFIVSVDVAKKASVSLVLSTLEYYSLLAGHRHA